MHMYKDVFGNNNDWKFLTKIRSNNIVGKKLCLETGPNQNRIKCVKP